MDLRQLKYFVQTVESGSLSKAARQLDIVQPALSQQMARLEEEVGKPLLVRSAQGVVPTESGRALYHHALFVLRQLSEAVTIARQEQAEIGGRVTVGLAPTTAALLGLPLLRHLKEHYPKIVLNMIVALPVHLDERARQSLLDVAVLFSKTAASELVFEPLLEEPVLVIVPAGSTLVRPEAESLTLAEVAELPLVLSSPLNFMRRRIAMELERAGLTERIVAEIDSVELVMRYVAEGGGATIQPWGATRAHGTPADWRCLPISDVPLSRTNYLYALPMQRLTASGAIVRAEIRSVVRNLVTSGMWRGGNLLEATRT